MTVERRFVLFFDELLAEGDEEEAVRVWGEVISATDTGWLVVSDGEWAHAVRTEQVIEDWGGVCSPKATLS